MALIPRNVLSFRNPLAWPAQRRARLNPDHVALTAGLVPKLAVVGTAVNSVQDITTGLFSNSGSVSTYTGQTGPVLRSVYPSPTSLVTFSGRDATAYTSVTAAAIFTNNGIVNGRYYALFMSGSNYGWQFLLKGTGSNTAEFQWGWNGHTATGSGLYISPGVPYLLLVSQNGAVGLSFLIKNLVTGAVQTATTSAATTGSSSNGTYVVGGDNIGDYAGGDIAALAYLQGALSTAEMQAWAADPWSFWYPPSAIEQMMLAGGPTLPIGAGSFNITTSWAAASPSLSAGTMNLTTGWSGVSPTAGYATGAGSMPLLSWSSGGVGAEINAQAGSMAWTFDGHMGNPPYSVVMSDTIKISDPLQYPFVGSLLVQNLTVHDASTVHWTWGRTLNQNLTIHDTEAEKVTYHVTDSEVIHLASALIRTFPAVLSQNLTVHMAETIALALTVLQRLKIVDALGPQTKFHLALVQAMLMNDALKRFFSAVLSQNLTVHPVMARTYVTSPVLSQNLTVHGALANSLVLQFYDTLDLTEHDIVNMIYKGDPLVDQINLTGLYVSPSGTATTWAINTRTNAVTEYTNYNFNSFAPFGLKYIAAASDGIYELDGENDDGESIIADIISGYMQLNNTKMAGLKGVYLAVRGVGQWYLKLIAGNGLTYTYQLTVQPGLMNTKVNIGKGLRTRYMAFQLTSIDGSDFDLDSLEFVPMLSDRRV